MGLAHVWCDHHCLERYLQLERRPAWFARRRLSSFKGRAFIGDMLALAGAWMGAGYIIIGRKLRPIAIANRLYFYGLRHGGCSITGYHDVFHRAASLPVIPRWRIYGYSCWGSARNYWVILPSIGH